MWDSNVRALLGDLSRFVGYAFDDSDWRAIETALPDTDADDPDSFYEYPLVGRPQLTVRLARASGAYPVTVIVSGRMNRVLRARIETAIELLSEPLAQPYD